MVMVGLISQRKPVQLKGKWIVPKGREIGKVTITSVEPNLAYAKLLEKSGDIQIGFKVEELIAQTGQGTGNRE